MQAPRRRRWGVLAALPRPDGLARPESDWLLSPVFAAHVSELLNASELAALGLGSRSHDGATCIMAHAAMERRHGLRVAQGTVPDLHAFDCLPNELAVDLCKYDARRVVEAGAPLDFCWAGGHRRKLTMAQMPPAADDRWRLDVMPQR